MAKLFCRDGSERTDVLRYTTLIEYNVKHLWCGKDAMTHSLSNVKKCKGVTVDMRHGTWWYTHATLNQVPLIVRSTSHTITCHRGGISGMYDRHSIGHLDSMAHDALAS